MGLACISIMIKTGSFDNAMQEFSLGYPLWYISHYTMLYKHDKRSTNMINVYIIFGGVFLYILFSIFQEHF